MSSTKNYCGPKGWSPLHPVEEVAMRLSELMSGRGMTGGSPTHSHSSSPPLYLPKAAPRSPRTRCRSFCKNRRSGRIWTFPRWGVTAPSSWAASSKAQDSGTPVRVKIKPRASSSQGPGIVASRVKDSGNKGEYTVMIWGHPYPQQQGHPPPVWCI